MYKIERKKIELICFIINQSDLHMFDRQLGLPNALILDIVEILYVQEVVTRPKFVNE